MGRDHRGSSSRASNRSSVDTTKNTRIPAPKSAQVSSTRLPSSRMTINMTTTITTSGSHSGLIVQSGVASAPSPSHGHRHADPWSLPSVSSPLPSIGAPPPAPQQHSIAAAPIEEMPPTSEDEYAPPSHHSAEMPRLARESPYAAQPSAYQQHQRYEQPERESPYAAQPTTYQPQRYEQPESETPYTVQSPAYQQQPQRYEQPVKESPYAARSTASYQPYQSERESEVSYVDPQDVQLNTFNTNPPPPAAPSERVSRRDQSMRPDTTSTTTYMEIYREPGEPLHAYQRLALPPNQKPDLLYGPRYEQWSNARTETLIDDRSAKAVQWKSDLVETDDETPPLTVQTRGRDASSSPSYVRARSRETRQDMKNGRLIKESISDEDITIETRSAALSPRLFSPSSTVGSPRIGTGASPAPVHIGWGAAPPSEPLVVSPLPIGSGARPLSPMSVDTRGGGIGYVATPLRPASRARTPDDYHDALMRRARSPSPLRRSSTAATSPYYATSPGYSSSLGYSRPPPSYRSDSRYGSPIPPQGSLDRSKSRSGDIFMLYQTRDALGEIVGHL